MALTLEDVDLYSPDVYVDAPPFEAFAYLRRECPVFRQEMPDGTFYWAVLKHHDVVEVARDPLVFSAEIGGVVLEDQPPEQLEQTKNMLLMMDPPRHSELRKNVYPHFRPRQIQQLEARIRTICRDLLARGVEMGDVEFVHDLAALVPSEVFGEMMGIPPEDRPQINRWAEMMTGGQDPDVNPDGYAAASGNDGSVNMAMYGMEFARTRRGHERGGGGSADRRSTESSPATATNEAGDLGDLLLATEVDGQPMTDLEFGFFFVQLVTAGNDTTRTMISSGLLALLEHPEELARLRADRALVPSAVEEILRYANPLHYFRRTATSDATVRGQAIKAGEKLAMIYTSANRDEDAFDTPEEFDVGRHPNPQLSFGIGEHYCLGVHLARLEGRIWLEELLDSGVTIDLTGEPRRQRSNLNNALKSLPVHLRA